MIIVLVTGALGLFFLARKGRSYHLAVIIIHGILSLFILAGSYYLLQGMTNSKIFLSISAYLLVIAACAVFISGVPMAITKKDTPKLALFHKIGSLLIVIPIIAGIVFLAVKI